MNYPADVGTPTADLLTAKLLINSIISTTGAERFTMDIKNFHLNTPMARREYLHLKLSDMPYGVIKEYGIRKKATTDGYVYVAVSKGMYRFPHARIIAQQLLEERLGKERYFQSKFTPGYGPTNGAPSSLTS